MTKKPLRILFVTPYIPASTRLRPNGFLRELSKRHQITSVCLIQPEWEAEYLSELHSSCEAVFPIHHSRIRGFLQAFCSLPGGVPSSVAYCKSNNLNRTVNKLLSTKHFDVVHTEFLRAAQYTANLTNVVKIFDSVDSMTLAYQRAKDNPYTSLFHRLLAWEEWLKIRKYELSMVRKYDRVLASSPVDKKFLELPDGPQVDVIPNGIDLEYFRLAKDPCNSGELVFIGKMNYYVNVDAMIHFTREIFPRITHENQQTRLTIVGWNPTKPVKDLANHPAIQVTGGVPDIRPYLKQSAIFVCPLLSGAGIQNKVLQAMAVGTAVVATSIVANAISAQDGLHLLVADKSEDFANAVLELMRNNALRQSLCINARRFVEKNHDWPAIGLKLETIYEQLVF